jgi:formate dehydrogenase subunit delta
MDEAVMVHKANSIAQFFDAYTEEEAVAGVANHIQMFWVPDMRRQLHEYIANGGQGLRPSVVAAEKQVDATRR